MSTDNQQSTFGYGYDSDASSESTYHFGLNSGKTFMTKFEYIANGGKNGAAQEALDIVFNINGTERSYRMFPVTQAFDEGNVAVSDPNHPAMKEAMKEFNQRVVHILKAFRSEADIQASLQRRIPSFRDYCMLCASMLPANYAKIALDIFMHYQWKIKGENKATFLEIPGKTKYGGFLCATVPHNGPWKAVIDPENGNLHYFDDSNAKHPFARGKWFMDSNYATQQKEGNALDSSNAGTAPPPRPNGASPAPTAW